MVQNISQVYNCYGCGVCATVCSQKIIDIRLNKNGFYEPFISNENQCTQCGLCTEVCAYLHETLSLQNPNVKSYAAWSKNHLVRRKCSSGGIGFEVGCHLINQGFHVCGVRYDAEQAKAVHYIADTKEAWVQSIGSKYIQSYTVEGFQSIHRKEKYLVTGTPCQIDSFRRYIQKFHCEDNFVLLDFFCHGVPSMHLWEKYTHWVKKQVGEITYVSWRNKQTRWHDSWAMAIDEKEKYAEKVDWHESYNMLIKGKKNYLNSRLTQGDMFYALFLGDCCLGKQCMEHCKYKYNHSAADIRIGDCWGNTYLNNEDGVSTAIAFTAKGDEILHGCNCELIEHPFSIVAEGQMKAAPKPKKWFVKIQYALNDPLIPIETVYNIYIKHHNQDKWKQHILNPRQSIKKIIKKIV